MFSICSTKAGTLPSCVASTTSDPEFIDFIVVLLLNFDSILQQKCKTREIQFLEKGQNRNFGQKSEIYSLHLG